MGDDEWSVFVLRDFGTFFTKGQNQPVERSLPVREEVAATMMMTNTELIVIGPRSMTSAEFSFCFALLSLESTNHGTILITCCHRRAWWETMFPFLCFFFYFILFYFFLFPAWASDWLFYFFLVYSFASCILTPPTCSTFALWCHHVIITIINIIIIKYKMSLILGSFGCC